MRIAIFSDVHANLPALESFVKETRPSVDAYICLGDVVNYGPWNDECLELIHPLPGIVLLEGNHERLFLGKDTIDNEIPMIKEFFGKSFQYFSRHELITSLPSSFELDSYLCIHTINNKNVYPDTKISPARNYIIGHTHHQFEIRSGNGILINCGSIGQNRGNISKISYLLYNMGSGHIQFCEHPYPIRTLLQELIRRNYPRVCIDYYTNKMMTST